MTVFVDTYALIAWMNPRDQDHVRVSNYLDQYNGDLLTTEWILVEFADAFASSAVRPISVALLQAVRTDPAIEIMGFAPRIYQAGIQLYSSRPDKEWSLTDCTSFAAMSERGVTDALTGDHHFEQAGFRAVFK
jgi:hypothetical protein